MANGPADSDDDDPPGLRVRYFQLRRQYHQAVAPAGRLARETSELQMLASWALRSGLGGWAIVRQGAVKVTTRAFDALDRDSIIGPGWAPWSQGDQAFDPADSHGRPLADIAISEARALFATRAVRRRSRHHRGTQVVDLTVERAATGHLDEPLVLVNVRDVTDMVQSEARLAELSARLRGREQVARAGGLAIEVGHDLGNLVGALSARLMLLEAEGQLAPQSLHALKGIAEAQSALVAKLKLVARRGQDDQERPRPLHLLDEVISPAVEMLESTLRPPSPRAPVLVRVDPQVADLPPVLAVRDELLNLIMNLIANARDAMPQGGLIHLRGKVADGAVLLAVEDQGPGIPEAVLPHVFEPFFTTKGERGTGLGLALARKLMRAVGGEITARNRPEGGACIELRFCPDRAEAPAIEQGSGGHPDPEEH